MTSGLHRAAREGDVDRVKHLLSQAISFSAGSLISLRNLSEKQDSSKSLIVNGGVEHDSDKPDGHTIKIDPENPDTFLLNALNDPNLRDEDGRTPLHIAAEKDKHSVCQVLLEHGADLFTLDFNGDAPVDVAIRNDNLQIVTLMLSNMYKYQEEDGLTECVHKATRYLLNTSVTPASCMELADGRKFCQSAYRMDFSTFISKSPGSVDTEMLFKSNGIGSECPSDILLQPAFKAFITIKYKLLFRVFLALAFFYIIFVMFKITGILDHFQV